MRITCLLIQVFDFVDSRRAQMQLTRGVNNLQISDRNQDILKLLYAHARTNRAPLSDDIGHVDRHNDTDDLREYQTQWLLRRKLRHRVKEIVQSQNPGSYYKHVEL